jgi:hypothetical protein
MNDIEGWTTSRIVVVWKGVGDWRNPPPERGWHNAKHGACETRSFDFAQDDTWERLMTRSLAARGENRLPRLPWAPQGTMIGFVFWSLAIASSLRPRCACTSSGGVRASHWVSETSAKWSLRNISRKRSGVSPVFST